MVAAPAFQDRQRPSHDKWADTQDTVGATVVLEKNLNQALLGLQALGPTRTGPQL